MRPKWCGGGQLFDYEIVVVNDGSTDSSDEILKQYAGQYPHLKVLSKENGGAAAARKYAIDNSESDYLAFCDSDDYVDPDWLETMYVYLKRYSADFVLLGAYINDTGISKEYKKPYAVWQWNRHDAFLKFFEHIHLNGVLWTNLFNRSLFDNIEWNTKLKIGEDAYIIWQILVRVNNVVKIRVPKYHYMYNPDSLTKQKYDYDRYYSIRTLLERIVNDCEEEPLMIYRTQAIDMQYQWTFRSLYSMTLSNYRDSESQHQMQSILWKGGLTEWKKLTGWKHKMVAIALLISPSLTRRVYKLVKKVLVK